MGDIPHSLDLVIDFVNTVDHDQGSDAFETPAGAVGWLQQRGLLAASMGPGPSAGSERDAIRLREALRALMLANNGVQADPDAAPELERAARSGQLGVHFDANGSTLEPEDRGLAGALARVLIPVAEAMADGSWSRVKACRASDCQWAFYDRSRNRSGVWCDMAVCGNRTKVRAYRARSGEHEPLHAPARAGLDAGSGSDRLRGDPSGARRSPTSR
jgi:predicted RNA-binding Zn ribbon-like protein